MLSGRRVACTDLGDMAEARTFTVLFVCAANMCRSPTAHAMLRHKLRSLGLEGRVTVDSAGTHNLYSNSPPDERSLQFAAQRGYDLSDLRARHLQDADFVQADLILVMDWNNLSLVQQRCPPQFPSAHALLRVQLDVPDRLAGTLQLRDAVGLATLTIAR